MGLFEGLFVAVTIITLFAIPFAVFAYVRYLRYKETITLADYPLGQQTRGRGRSRQRDHPQPQANRLLIVRQKPGFFKKPGF
jgi:hypothetical protein